MRFLPLQSLPPYVSDFIGPVQEKAYDLEKFFTNTTDTFLTITKLKDKHSELQQKRITWKTKQHLINSLEQDNTVLRKILGFRRRSYYRLIPAEVIARSAENWFAYLTINRGSSDGLRKNLPVINEEGLVGRIVEVGKDYSKVLTITAPQSRISIKDRQTGDLGIAIGRLHHPLQLKYINNTATITPNNTITTSGISDIFPKGILVGNVKKVRKEKYNVFQKVEVTPAVNFSKVRYVFIVVGRKKIVKKDEK